jgi:hypothetical protein
VREPLWQLSHVIAVCPCVRRVVIMVEAEKQRLAVLLAWKLSGIVVLVALMRSRRGCLVGHHHCCAAGRALCRTLCFNLEGDVSYKLTDVAQISRSCC